jgi:hypothetical protein
MPGGVVTNAAWTLPGTQSGEEPGFSVSGGLFVGGVPSLIIGAPYATYLGQANCGAAFIYLGNPPQLNTLAIVSGANNHAGYSVAYLQDVFYETPGFAVGAPNSTVGGNVTTWSVPQ